MESSASAARDRAAGWAEVARDPPHHHAASRRGRLANGAAATRSRAPPCPAPPRPGSPAAAEGAGAGTNRVDDRAGSAEARNASPHRAPIDVRRHLAAARTLTG